MRPDARPRVRPVRGGATRPSSRGSTDTASRYSRAHDACRRPCRRIAEHEMRLVDQNRRPLRGARGLAPYAGSFRCHRFAAGEERLVADQAHDRGARSSARRGERRPTRAHRGGGRARASFGCEQGAAEPTRRAVMRDADHLPVPVESARCKPGDVRRRQRLRRSGTSAAPAPPRARIRQCHARESEARQHRSRLSVSAYSE